MEGFGDYKTSGLGYSLYYRGCGFLVLGPLLGPGDSNRLGIVLYRAAGFILEFRVQGLGFRALGFRV